MYLKLAQAGSGIKKKGLQSIVFPVLITLFCFSLLPLAIFATGEDSPMAPLSSPIAQGAFGGANGAPWTLYEDGSLIVSEGGINNAVTTSPWAPWSANIERIVFTGPITAGTSLNSLFRSLTNLTRIEGLEYFDTSAVSTMQALFQDTPALTHILGLSDWDTSNVTSLNASFLRCAVYSLDLSRWDTSNVRTMQYLFQAMPNLTSLDLSSWNTANVTTFLRMFQDSPQLHSIGDISSWDTANVTSMQSTFHNTPQLTNISGVSHWDTGSVSSLNAMFLGSGMTSLDLSRWNTSNVTNMAFLFADSALTTLTVTNWDTSRVTNMGTMFRDSLLSSLDLSSWDTRNASMGNLFQRATNLRLLILGEHWLASGSPSLPPAPSAFPFAGTWQNIGSGDALAPQGSLFYTSAQLMTGTNATANTWVWARAQHRVSFEPGPNGTLEGGSPNVSISLPHGTVLGTAHIPTARGNPGFVFTGWAPFAPYGHTVVEDIHFIAQFAHAPDRQAYLVGTNDGLIRPQANISRAEVATIFFRLIDDNTRREHWSQENPFPDVNLEDWFNNAVSTLNQLGLFQGKPDGNFSPHQPMTRAELTAVVTRFMNVIGTAVVDHDFFADIANHWASSYINTSAVNDWVSGPYGHGAAFYPDRFVYRAELAAIINRIFDRLPETRADLLPDMITWPDNEDSTTWYYLYLQAASNSYTFTKDADGHERWLSLIPVPDWTALERPNSTPDDLG